MIGLYVLITHTLYITLAVWVTGKLARLTSQRGGRIGGLVAAMLLLTMFALVPIADLLLTLPRYYALCETQAGIKVYGKMALPAGFYSNRGEPLFIHKNGDIDGYFNKRGADDRTNLYKHIEFGGKEVVIDTPTKIRKQMKCIKNKNTGRLLACRVSFGLTSGWWSKIFFIDARELVQASSCSRISFEFSGLHQEIFYEEAMANN